MQSETVSIKKRTGGGLILLTTVIRIVRTGRAAAYMCIRGTDMAPHKDAH